MHGWGLPSVLGVPQALVDDTEDVSLDFGNEEELAFRKAKIRYVETRPWASSPKMQIRSFTNSFIQNMQSNYCVHLHRPCPLGAYSWVRRLLTYEAIILTGLGKN